MRLYYGLGGRIHDKGRFHLPLACLLEVSEVLGLRGCFPNALEVEAAPKVPDWAKNFC